MICTRCLLRSALRTSRNPIAASTKVPLSPTRPTSRALATATPLSAAKATTASATDTSTPQRSPSAATSTAAAQAFSAPQSTNPQPTPSNPTGSSASDPKAGPSLPGSHSPAIDKAGSTVEGKATPAIVSSIPSGTPLQGLNYFKGKEDPVALEDSEYPAWLWDVLETPKKSKGAEAQGQVEEETDPRLYSKSAKARRAANKRLRAARAVNPQSLVPRTPVYERTVDLPADAGAQTQDGGPTNEGETAREELQRAMRVKRRKDIKTKNFLQGMR